MDLQTEKELCIEVFWAWQHRADSNDVSEEPTALISRVGTPRLVLTN